MSRVMTEAQYAAHQAKHGRRAVDVGPAGRVDRKSKPPVERSQLEVQLEAQIEKTDLPAPEYDVTYLVGTRHRLDVCWRSLRFGVECQGGPHRIKGRFAADIRKRIEGLLQGWVVIEVDREAIQDGRALKCIETMYQRLAIQDGRV